MKWVKIDKYYLNADKIECFFWEDDSESLLVFSLNQNDPTLVIPDTGKKFYHSLLAQLGLAHVSPIESLYSEDE